MTFLFTDLETSTRLWEEQPEGVMGEALARHDVIVRGAIEAHHGVVFATMGDGMAAAFASAPDALAAALDAQRGLDIEAWGEAGAYMKWHIGGPIGPVWPTVNAYALSRSRKRLRRS